MRRRFRSIWFLTQPQFRSAEIDERAAAEAAAEQQDAGGILLRQQHRGILKLAPRTRQVALAPEHEAETQVRHRECRIQVNPDPVAVDRRRAPAAMLMTEGGQVMRRRIEIVEGQQ